MVQLTIGALTCPPPCFGFRNHGWPLQGLTGKGGKLGIGAEQHQAIMLSQGCQHAIKVNTVGLGVGTSPSSRMSTPSTCSENRRVCRGPLQSRHLATIEVEAQHLHRSRIHLDLVGGCHKQRLGCWQERQWIKPTPEQPMAVEQKPLRVHYWWRAPGSRALSSQATSSSAVPKVCPPWRSMPSNAGEIVWELARAQPPNTNGGWLVTVEPLNRGQDLALVVSVTHDARVDAKRAIDSLALPIGRLAHAGLQQPGPDAVVDGGHARWLGDALAMQVRELVVADPPRRLHVFAACPVGLMLLFGQRADAWGPTTVYEFAFEDGSRSYFPGMASRLV